MPLSLASEKIVQKELDVIGSKFFKIFILHFSKSPYCEFPS